MSSSLSTLSNPSSSMASFLPCTTYPSTSSPNYSHSHPIGYGCWNSSYKKRKPHQPLRIPLSLFSAPSPSSSSSSSSSGSFSYDKFIQFALTETERRRTPLLPSPLQEKYNSITSLDGRTELRMLSFQSPKIRLLRSLSIENETVKVLDFAGFARPEFDVPIFCANFFTTANINIIVLDLNPLHDVVDRKDYREKYYAKLMGLGLRYAEVFPWGGKLTSESLKFFSPIVIWTKFPSEECMYDGLYSAFTEYYTAWLHLVNDAVEETDEAQVLCNCEAQHRYLTWRAEKDPGHGILKKLVGEVSGKELVRNFLFDGINEMGSKGFLDYFPEYRSMDGTVNQKRSMMGKSFESRPWDSRGEFIGTNITAG